jgi:hypothetical protein
MWGRFYRALLRWVRERRPEHWVTCYHCGRRFYREIPRGPQDSESFLCDRCDEEYNQLIKRGLGGWPRRVS